MDILTILACLTIFAVFGFLNYRYNRQKGEDLAEEFKHFNQK